MAKFFGVVGYSDGTEEVKPGVWKEKIVTREYYGDVFRNSRKLDDDQKYNANISVGNSISIVSDPYANEHFFAIRYVSWQGALWIVSDVSVEPPRLVLRLGGSTMAPPATRREELHEKLVEILGSPNVYFQPPENLLMSYPAIVYERDYSKILPADNIPYIWAKRYQITVIDGDPDSETFDKLEQTRYCSFIRHFESDELHHNIYNLYF